ncbi:uncharacterized protein LOC144106856 isoform X1 [Amblyomma americanum]
MLNIDTLRIGSPPAHHPRVLADPLLPTNRVVPTEPSPEAPRADEARSPVKKGTLRSFFREHRHKKRRKKELLRELDDLQRENAKLQSEYTYAKLILSELKQEHLNELEKASRTRAQQRKNETQVQTSACQTDPCTSVLGDFRAVPRKNYAFIYNLFTVPTPEQLRKSLDKFQKSGMKVSVKDDAKGSATDDAEHSAKTSVHNDAENASRCDAQSELKENEAEKAPEVDAERTAAELNKEMNEPVEHSQHELPAKENSDAAMRTEPDGVRSSVSATVSKRAAKEKSTISFSSYNTDRSAQSVILEPPRRSSVPAQPQSVTEIAEENGAGLKEPETRPSEGAAQENTARDAPCVMRDEAPQEQPAVADENSVAQEGAAAENCLDAADESRRDDGLDAVLQPKVSVESSPASDRSSESSLLLKLRQAISNVAASLEPGTNSVRPDDNHDAEAPRRAPPAVNYDSQTLVDMVQRRSTGEEGMTSRRFLPPNHDDVRALRDPGRKEFEKRRRVSCSALRPPLQKAVVMNAALCCHTEIPGGATPTATRRGATRTPVTAAGTPRPWDMGIARPAAAPEPELSTVTTPPAPSLTAPLNAVSASDRDSLSSDSEADTDCAADGYESSTEFHGSEKNVAKTALQNRTSGFNRGMNQASGRSTFKSDAMTAAAIERTATIGRKKSYRKKRNSPRHANSARSSSSSSSSEDSGCTSRRWRRRSSVAGTRTPSTYSGTSTGTTSRATTATRPVSSTRPLSPITVLSGTVTDTDASRVTTAFGRKGGASTRTTVRATSRATSTAASSPVPKTISRGASRATTPTSFLSTPQGGLSSCEMSPSESEAATPTTPRRFLADLSGEQGLVHCKRSIFENLSSAGYTRVDDRAPGKTNRRSEAQQSSGLRGSGLKGFATQDKTGRAQMPPLAQCGKSRDPKKKSTFIVQRAELYAPFPPKIMRSLLPSFIDVDPSVRPDMVPQAMPFDPGRHGDEKSNADMYKGHCLHKASTSPPKQPMPQHWEDKQSCLLPAFYSFSDDSRPGDQANRKTTRFDLGEAI